MQKLTRGSFEWLGFSSISHSCHSVSGSFSSFTSIRIFNSQFFILHSFTDLFRNGYMAMTMSTWSKTWISHISMRWQKKKYLPIHMGFDTWLWVNWRYQHNNDKNSWKKKRKQSTKIGKTENPINVFMTESFRFGFIYFLRIFGVEAFVLVLAKGISKHSIVMFVDFIP